MEWKSITSFGSYLLVLTVLVLASGHPLRKHGSKSQHVIGKKFQIRKQLHHKTSQNKQKKSLLNGQFTTSPGLTEDAKKKGTIRISGPWHTDSGLDRNVDPMEDSYVKKIISSNEGLNFNKDMAEAGEVFDVNGIEDFYDRNALITYEVNGHEIPVHLKQKLTPQSQTMFPEYGHDSPSSVDTSSRTGHSYSQQPQTGHKATTFYGMSLKDMPEYKVQDTPSVDQKQQDTRLFSGRMRMGSPDQEASYTGQSFRSRKRPNLLDSSVIMPYEHKAEQRARQAAVESLASEYEQANDYGNEDVKFANGVHDSQFHPHAPRHSFQSSTFGLGTRPDLDDQRELASLKEGSHLGNRVDLFEEISRLKGHRNPPMFAGPLHSEHLYTKRPSDSVQFSDRPKPSPFGGPTDELIKPHEGVKTFFDKSGSEDDSNGEHGTSRGVGKEYDGVKLAPKIAEESKNNKDMKNDDSSKFFQQLEKIDEEQQRNEKEKQDFSPEKIKEISATLPTMSDKMQQYSQDPERTKAKDKLLKILGDLTSKLKGMEAAVKDTHTDERRESPSVFDQQDAKSSAFESNTAEEAREDQKQKERFGEEKQLSENAKAAMENGKNTMDHANNSPWESSHNMEDGKSGSEAENSHTSYQAHPSDSDGVEGSQERVSHLISNLKQHGRPFIFNTDEIEYKGPSYEDKSLAFNDDHNDNKDNVRHDTHEREGHMVERPILSSFYHDSEHDDEFDSTKFHSENGPSAEIAVVPTQRDVGRKQQEINKTGKPGIFEEKQNAHQKGYQNSEEKKSDPDDDLPDYNEVKDAAIFEENLIRKKYHAPNLRWSDDLSDEAQKQADDLAEEKILDINKKNFPKSINVAMLPLNSLNVGKDSADVWQKEATKFDFVSPLISKKNSDFVQMVWKSAKEFGLGVAKSRDKENWIVVAKYDTPAVSEYEKLKVNVESDIPVADPYSDIARNKIYHIRKYKD